MESKKITFANQLRGFAVLCVIVSHYLGVYWSERTVIARYAGAPIVSGAAPRIIHFVFFPMFDPGPFGVALFFLISGFVIPFSLEKLGAGRFMVARIFRIFPTYWAATFVTLAAIYASTRYWSSPFYVRLDDVAKNLFLVNQQMGSDTIDMVNWTLCIEMLFYIAAVLMWPFIKRAAALALVNFSLVVMALVTWWPTSWDAPVHLGSVMLVFSAFKYQLMLVSFMFIGTLFNLRLHGRITTRTLAGATAAIFLSFMATWPKTPIYQQFPVVAYDYFYALVVFSGCFALRNQFRSWRVVDFFADISYPLYLLHAGSGYVIIRILMERHFRYYQAAAVAAAAAVSAAYILHRIVEMPTSSIWRLRPSLHSSTAPTQEQAPKGV